jgi:hypothetical protein
MKTSCLNDVDRGVARLASVARDRADHGHVWSGLTRTDLTATARKATRSLTQPVAFYARALAEPGMSA